MRDKRRRDKKKPTPRTRRNFVKRTHASLEVSILSLSIVCQHESVTIHRMTGLALTMSPVFIPGYPLLTNGNPRTDD